MSTCHRSRFLIIEYFCIDNLKDVKQLVANMPIINPSPDYVITHHSKAIIIEGRAKRPAIQTRKVSNHAAV